MLHLSVLCAMQSPLTVGDNRLRQQSPHILYNECGVFTSEKHTHNATIEQQCNNKKKLSVMVMINHFANQSQTCQLLKILKTIFFQTLKRICEKWCNQSQVQLIYKIHIDYREGHIDIDKCFWHHILVISHAVYRNLPVVDNIRTIKT